MNPASAANVLNRDEVVSAIRLLSTADLIRLRKVADRYARGRIEADDLLQEAFARALDTRTCPAHVSVVKFLAEAMRSIADGMADKAENRLVLVPVAKTGGEEDEAFNVHDPSPDSETHLLESEAADKIRSALLELFADDPVARDIVEGTMEGMEATELRELTGLDLKGFATKRRLIRRRIDNAFPEGWKQ